MIITLFLTGNSEEQRDAVTTDTGEEQRDAVMMLSCVQPTNMPELLSTGDDTLLITWNEGNVTKFLLADTDNDRIIAQTELAGSWLLLDECFSDGGFAIYDWNSLSWIFFDGMLNKVGELCCEDVGGVFSHDRSHYYHVADGCLCRTDTETNETKPIELPYTLYCTDIVGISPEADMLALHFEMSPFSGDCGTAIIDVEKENLICLCGEDYLPHFTKDGVAFRSFDPDAAAYSVSFGDSEKFYSADAAIFSGGCTELHPLAGTDYLLGIDKGSGAILFSLGETISASMLSRYGISGRIGAVCRMKNSDYIAAATYDASFNILLIDPALLTFTAQSKTMLTDSLLTVDKASAEAYSLALKGSPLPEYLSAEREHANRLEEKYGVTIFLSSQCDSMHEVFTYDFSTTGSLPRDEEVEMTEKVICALDEVLALYPEGFFRQFCGVSNSGGIRFIIVGEIESDCGIIGETVERQGWQNIMLDARQEYFRSVICHELWHAMENKIVMEDSFAFDDDTWSAFVPEGFAYYYDTSQTDPESNRWTLYRADRSEPLFFTDAYARQNEHEDRARLMEYMMTKDYFIPELTESPFTDGKLQIMFSAVREHFAIDGTGEPLWEQNYRKHKE